MQGINCIMRNVLFILLILFTVFASAQQGPQLIMPEEDSIYIESVNPAFSSSIFQPGILNTDQITFNLQTLSFNDQLNYLKQFNINNSLLEMPRINYIPEIALTGFSPYYSNAQIFGGSSAKLNDKFTIGGFSYGANSVFSAPLPNQNNSYYDTYGSTMFIQYKVSKNFKIETRVSVGHSNQGPPPPPGR